MTHIRRLRQHLEQLVHEERYEEAARVRDEIRALQQQMLGTDAQKEE